MTMIPTMIWFLDNEWNEGLPGPAYMRKYGVDPGGPEAMGETQSEWNDRMARNKANAADYPPWTSSPEVNKKLTDESERIASGEVKWPAAPNLRRAEQCEDAYKLLKRQYAESVRLTDEKCLRFLERAENAEAELAALRAMNASPRCPKCGFVMCEQFDERPVTAIASVIIPNGNYICYHCKEVTA